ncbi:T9SS type A sorting domain-containing protein [Epilithonimonas sp.]|uniref:T9SS type A sorting domain-containing protein n=1 Tax=Epilithonimonas sp. TaxID=2894511 RepID=UPI00289CE39E|nr:T9SS type A sorting domain-containing protein [Epilithonimonas sp.]
MRKILFSCLLATASSLAFAQNVFTDNFEAATLGNLGTDITGVTPGQGGWYITAATTASNSAASNFQVVNNTAAHGKVLSILGSASTVGTKQINQNDKLVSVWGTRTPGNDILVYEFDVYSGPTTTSQNTGRIYLWDGSAANKCVIGFALNMATKQHTLIAYSDPAEINGGTGEVGNWGFTFNQALSADTWYKVGLAWDSVTGEIAYKIVNEDTGAIILDEFYQGAGVGATPNLANIQVQAVPNTTVTANTVAATVLFDNISLKATNTIDLLAVNDVVNTKTNIGIYPNPTTDFLKFDTNAKIDAVQVFDISGKAVNAQLIDNQVDVRNLQNGVYLLKTTTAEGTSSQKFIKK